MLTWRVGVASSPAAGKAMAEYLSTELLRPEKEELARYYAGKLAPAPVREQTGSDRVGRERNREPRGFREALGQLAAAVRAAGRGGEIETDLVMDERVAGEFMQGPAGADGAEPACTIGRVRPELSPAFAARLGIRDPRERLTVAGLANLLNGQKVDGRDIEGRHRKSASLSVAEAFGLDPKAPPSGEAVRNILAGRRADGGRPRNDKGEDLTAARVQGARARFLQAMGVPTHREPSTAEIDNLLAGKLAAGGRINLGEYRRQMTATRARVAYIDFTFSADKSFSVAWALAPTEGERALIHQITKDAAAAAMNHAEYLLGEARIGRDGKGGSERGELAWIGFDHYTSRPTVDIARTDRRARAPRARWLKVSNPLFLARLRHGHLLRWPFCCRARRAGSAKRQPRGSPGRANCLLGVRLSWRHWLAEVYLALGGQSRLRRRPQRRTRNMHGELDRPSEWRDRAEEARVIAEAMSTPEAKHAMLQISEG